MPCGAQPYSSGNVACSPLALCHFSSIFCRNRDQSVKADGQSMSQVLSFLLAPLLLLLSCAHIPPHGRQFFSFKYIRAHFAS